MKKSIAEFLRRGFLACWLGPIILAILYLILRRYAAVETITVEQMCVGIFSLSALAFIAGGMNSIYQIEQLPLMVAILIHGSVLYVCYLITYLLNDWLERGIASILIFSGIFVVGYIAIWAIIYSITRRNIKKINAVLKQKQQEKKEQS